LSEVAVGSGGLSLCLRCSSVCHLRQEVATHSCENRKCLSNLEDSECRFRTNVVSVDPRSEVVCKRDQDCVAYNMTRREIWSREVKRSPRETWGAGTALSRSETNSSSPRDTDSTLAPCWPSESTARLARFAASEVRGVAVSSHAQFEAYG
jgi:hypothetical protein